MTNKQDESESILSDRVRFSQWAFDYAPRLLSGFVFIVGGFLLLTASTPVRLPVPLGLAEQFFEELPNYFAALAGLVLMVMAVGLARRVRLAYLLSVSLLATGLVVKLFAPGNMILVLLMAGLAISLLSMRSAFFRKSDISAMQPGGLWFLAVSLVIAVAAIGAALWAGHERGFIEAKWWDLVLHPMIGLAGRPVLFVALILAIGAFVCLVARPAKPYLPAATSDDLARVETILSGAEAPRPESGLAFSGDKRFLYAPSGKSFIMYAAAANSLVAMGGPIGKTAERTQLLEAFRKLAESEGVSAAVYAAPGDLLPSLLEAGFLVEKIGENAVLDLGDFSLSGRKREVIRRGRRKLAERRHATFRVSMPPHSDTDIAVLQRVSRAWLKDNGGEEKAFSLGRFDKQTLARCPIGIVEIEGAVLAFGTLWLTPDQGWAGVDLMRYDPQKAVTNTMDFLLVELILWAQRKGYGKFDLSMAPLAGLAETDEAALFARLGRMIYRHGGRFYNFQGLRRFKQKFDPYWEPRYIAVPARLALPIVLADAAILTNGSVFGGGVERAKADNTV